MNLNIDQLKMLVAGLKKKASDLMGTNLEGLYLATLRTVKIELSRHIKIADAMAVIMPVAERLDITRDDVFDVLYAITEGDADD